MSMAMAYGMKKRQKMARGGKMCAEGGDVDVDDMGEYDPMENPQPKENEAANMEDADMIARIMHKRKMYSRGGMVANDTPPIADSMPADFDDLALRDDLESSYTGESSGDEDGNEAMDKRDSDVVSKIMASRKKKDRMPRTA